MRMAGLAVALAVVTYVPGPAAVADPPSRTGLTCGLATTNDLVGVLANPGTEVGYMWGGPIAAADLPSLAGGGNSWDMSGNPTTVTMTCDVQITTPVYGDLDYVSATASGTGAVVLPPAFVWLQITTADPVYLCTTFTATDTHGDAETLYFDSRTSTLVADPASAECVLAIAQELPGKHEICDALGPNCPDQIRWADARAVVPSVVTP